MKGFLSNPTVLIEVEHVRTPDNRSATVCPPPTVTILGCVRKQGRLVLDRDLTVIGLLRLAGGPTGDQTLQIRIVRSTPQGEKTIIVNAKAVLIEKRAEYDLFLRPYDVLIVE